MNFISFDKVKWYDWFWIIPLLLVVIPYGMFVAWCMDKKD